jgi:hypothetical protein
MTIFPYRYYADADPQLNRLDLFECALQVDERPIHCYLITTFIETDNGIEEHYQLDLPPRCILTSQNIANIVMQVLPHYFTYDLNAILPLYMYSFQCLNDDLCPYDRRWKLGRVVLANRILENFNQSFICNTKIRVKNLKIGCQNAIQDLWGKYKMPPRGEVEKLLNVIIQNHINPLMKEFTEYLSWVPCNRLTDPIRQASQQLDSIRRSVHDFRKITRFCKNLLRALPRKGAYPTFPEYKIILQKGAS